MSKPFLVNGINFEYLCINEFGLYDSIDDTFSYFEIQREFQNELLLLFNQLSKSKEPYSCICIKWNDELNKYIWVFNIENGDDSTEFILEFDISDYILLGNLIKKYLKYYF